MRKLIKHELTIHNKLYLHPLLSASRYFTSQGIGKNKQSPGLLMKPTGALYTNH
jgi:hypothetical protein